MKDVTLTNKQARILAIHSQLLTMPNPRIVSRDAVYQIIDQLGYIQIDTISVINRAHHHTLWTRNNKYDSTMIFDLQSKDKKVFEYWGHAMSYIPMKDYRFFLPRMRNFEKPKGKWTKAALESNKKIMSHILDRIKDEGPLSAKDFAAPKGRKSDGWWDWKPAKMALELLYWRGDLMISERKGFQKKYDLRERVLPDHINMQYPKLGEVAEFLITRGLNALGVATEKEMLSFMQPGKATTSDLQIVDKELIVKTIRKMIKNNLIIPVKLENDLQQYYMLTTSFDALDSLPQISNQLHLLSPFDNLVIQRERLHRLFNFKYTIECYVPAPKRKYGYFVLPILYGDSFIGRVDIKADRKTTVLHILNLVFETELSIDDHQIDQLTKKIVEFARFHGSRQIKIKTVRPIKLKSLINRALNKTGF